MDKEQEDREGLLNRISVLEEENRQLRNALAPRMNVNLDLSPQQREIFLAIYSRTEASYEMLEMLLGSLQSDEGRDTKNHLKVIVHRIRKVLEPHGIRIQTIRGHGFRMQPGDKRRVLDLGIVDRQKGQRLNRWTAASI